MRAYFTFLTPEMTWDTLNYLLWAEIGAGALFLSKTFPCLRSFEACFSFFNYFFVVLNRWITQMCLSILYRNRDHWQCQHVWRCSCCQFSLFNLNKFILIACIRHDGFHWIYRTEAAVWIVWAALLRLDGSALVRWHGTSLTFQWGTYWRAQPGVITVFGVIWWWGKKKAQLNGGESSGTS